MLKLLPGYCIEIVINIPKSHLQEGPRVSTALQPYVAPVHLPIPEAGSVLNPRLQHWHQQKKQQQQIESLKTCLQVFLSSLHSRESCLLK